MTIHGQASEAILTSEKTVRKVMYKLKYKQIYTLICENFQYLNKSHLLNNGSQDGSEYITNNPNRNEVSNHTKPHNVIHKVKYIYWCLLWYKSTNMYNYGA